MFVTRLSCASLRLLSPQQEQQAPKSQVIHAARAKPLVKRHQSLDLWRIGYHLVAENVSANVFCGTNLQPGKYK